MGYVPAYYVNLIIVLGILVAVVLAFPVLYSQLIARRIKGRLLGIITTKDKLLVFKLLKTEVKLGEGEFVQDGEDTWTIVAPKVKLTRYPVMSPKILQGFQQTVPCLLLLRGRTEPLDWENPETGEMSSKELTKVLDPHLMNNLIEGAKEEGAAASMPKSMKTLLTIVAVVCVISLLVVIYIAFKK